MKPSTYLPSLFLAFISVSAMAQNAGPQCGTTNFDKSRKLFTIMNAGAGTVNQQCYFTVYRASDMPAPARRDPRSMLVEGNYAIEMSGGGGGGGGGASMDLGGGGGGAGAAPLHVVRYLAPGVYKMTIGTGGAGGSANGGFGADPKAVASEDGSPSNVTRANTGELVAGTQGADTWSVRKTARAMDGAGGTALPGGSRGGSGGDSGTKSEDAAQSGGRSQTPGYSGKPGVAGSESNRAVADAQGTALQRNAGGGGGAGVGTGGDGGTVKGGAVAGKGDLGGGGGGGRGGPNTAENGARGGNGFIRLSALVPIV
jgi:hypothetical protein